MFCSHLEQGVQSFQHKWKSIPITSKVELELSVLYEHGTSLVNAVALWD